MATGSLCCVNLTDGITFARCWNLALFTRRINAEKTSYIHNPLFLPWKRTSLTNNNRKWNRKDKKMETKSKEKEWNNKKKKWKNEKEMIKRRNKKGKNDEKKKK